MSEQLPGFNRLGEGRFEKAWIDNDKNVHKIAIQELQGGRWSYVWTRNPEFTIAEGTASTLDRCMHDLWTIVLQQGECYLRLMREDARRKLRGDKT